MPILSRRLRRDARRTEGAFYSTDFGEFILPYDRVRESASPDDTLLEFFQSTYVAAADLAKLGSRRAREVTQLTGLHLTRAALRSAAERPGHHGIGHDDRVPPRAVLDRDAIRLAVGWPWR